MSCFTETGRNPCMMKSECVHPEIWWWVIVISSGTLRCPFSCVLSWKHFACLLCITQCLWQSFAPIWSSVLSSFFSPHILLFADGPLLCDGCASRCAWLAWSLCSLSLQWLPKVNPSFLFGRRIWAWCKGPRVYLVLLSFPIISTAPSLQPSIHWQQWPWKTWFAHMWPTFLRDVPHSTPNC